MNNSDYGEGASIRQPQIPAVMPGGLYTRKQLVNNLGVSGGTIANWEKAGLQPIPNTGASANMYFADDVLEFMRKLKG